MILPMTDLEHLTVKSTLYILSSTSEVQILVDFVLRPDVLRFD